MGFGLKELKLLRNTINEIAEANKIPADQAQQKFYKDIAPLCPEIHILLESLIGSINRSCANSYYLAPERYTKRRSVPDIQNLCNFEGFIVCSAGY